VRDVNNFRMLASGSPALRASVTFDQPARTRALSNARRTSCTKTFSATSSGGGTGGTPGARFDRRLSPLVYAFVTFTIHLLSGPYGGHTLTHARERAKNSGEIASDRRV
jgi:hypothetical protein